MTDSKEITEYISRYLADMEYPKALGPLVPMVKYGLEGSGKRLRPLLVMAVCEGLGKERGTAIHQALAIEVFHNFTLVHDDVMDGSDLRRGKPTVWARYGQSTAILAGDATLSLAYSLLLRGCGGRAEELMECFSRGANEVYAGQQLDMEFEEREEVVTREYLQMIMLKTAALIRCAVMLGAIMGDADAASRSALDAYATGLGLAFQLRDDYLDTYGNEETFGKPIGGDIINNKKTWLLTTALAEDEGELKQLLDDDSLSPEEKVKGVRDVYDKLNLPKRISDSIEQYSRMAIAALDDVKLSDDCRALLTKLAESCMTRNV